MKTYKEFFIKEGLVRDLEKSFKSGSSKEIKCGDFIVYIDGKIHFETRDGKLRAPDKKTAKEIEDWCKQYSK